MAIIDIHTRSIDAIAENYARSRKNRLRPVSMAAALRAIKALMPDIAVSDEELVHILASKAIAYGHSVDFDLQRQTRSTQLSA